jgi:hypothetical protein
MVTAFTLEHAKVSSGVRDGVENNDAPGADAVTAGLARSHDEKGSLGII